jgi:thymidylate kinase
LEEARRGIFIVLEGLPGCGKTTVGTALQNDGWVFLQECATLLAEKGVPIGDRGVTSSDFLIVAEELKRIREIREIQRAGKNLAADGYFTTDLSFAYARYMLKRSKSYPACLNMYLEALSTGTLARPDLYVWFDVPMDTATERQEDRYQDDLTTFNRQMFRYVKKHFQFMHEIYEPDVPVLRVDGRKPVDETKKTILAETSNLLVKWLA